MGAQPERCTNYIAVGQRPAGGGKYENYYGSRERRQNFSRADEQRFRKAF
jgi:hypothetical protein